MTGLSGVEADENDLEYLKTSELYQQRKELESSDPNLVIPFPELPGESTQFLGKTTDGVIALSNYRLFVRFKDSFVNRPLGLIESVEYRDIFYIYVCCKDAHSFRCAFDTNETCMLWHKRLSDAISSPAKVQNVFAFAFHAFCCDGDSPTDSTLNLIKHMDEAKTSGGYNFDKEVARLKFDTKGKGPWRISHINEEFKICHSYPKLHIVPKSVTDEHLKSIATFRGGRRFPSVVWRNVRNGAVIARCSQPEVGWFGWRNNEDEDLMGAIAKACVENGASPTTTPTPSTPSTENGGVITTNGNTVPPPAEQNGVVNNSDIKLTTDGAAVVADKCMESAGDALKHRGMLIVDARSYPAAVANRAKGGGVECIDYYPNCQIDFQGLANIHSIRKSFQAVRSLCTMGGDHTVWLQGLDTTKWLHHLSNLLKATLNVVDTVERKSQPVLIHCSDGWDRTPQLTALSQLVLDPYYRTIEGFRVLVEKEWLEFGHKFADRCGLGRCSEDTNERCPVFMQWLDAVHQLTKQFPRAFQFNQSFLVKLAQHTYSNLFGTFLCNTVRERETEKVYGQTGSVWGLLHAKNMYYFNHLYQPDQDQVLDLSYHLKDIQLWRAVYLYKTPPSAALDETFDGIPLDGDTPSDVGDSHVLTKTRSCENLSAGAAADNIDLVAHSRRLSDPNVGVTIDAAHVTATMSSDLAVSGFVDDVVQQTLHDVMDDKEAAKENGVVNGGGAHVEIQNGGHVRFQNGGDFNGGAGLMNGSGHYGAGEEQHLLQLDAAIEKSEASQHVVTSQSEINGGSGGVVVSTRSEENTQQHQQQQQQPQQQHSLSEQHCNAFNSTSPNSGDALSREDNQQQQQQQQQQRQQHGDIPLLNGIAEHVPGAESIIGTSGTGSDITLYSDGDTEIAEDARTLCGSFHESTSRESPINEATTNCITNGVSDSTSTTATATTENNVDNKNGVMGENRIRMNGFSDTPNKCSSLPSDGRYSVGVGVNGGGVTEMKTVSVQSCDNVMFTPNGGQSNNIGIIRHQQNGGDLQQYQQQQTSQNYATKQLHVKAHYTMMNGNSAVDLKEEQQQQNGGGGGGIAQALLNGTSSSPRNNIAHLRAAHMSTSTSDISDSHVSINMRSNLITQIVKANSLKEEDQALLKLDILPPVCERAQKRRLQLDVSASAVNREVSRESRESCYYSTSSQHVSGRSSYSSTPSPSIEKGSSWLSRPASGVSRFLDVDGLNKLDDPAADHVTNLHVYYMARMRKQQRIINTLIYNLSAGKTPLNGKLADDLLGNLSSDDEARSLGAHSNAPSDVSWEQVNEQDANMTLWVPDHVVTHCAGCDSQFFFARRKHHCRNCGQVFCDECAHYYTPIPSQQLKEPSRVCRKCFSGMHGDIISLESMTSDAESEINSAMEELVVA